MVILHFICVEELLFENVVTRYMKKKIKKSAQRFIHTLAQQLRACAGQHAYISILAQVYLVCTQCVPNVYLTYCHTGQHAYISILAQALGFRV
jgi:hypothetical protein